MSNIVFSTDPDWGNTCEVCGNSKNDCICNNENSEILKNQTVYITRDRKQRGGKTVSVISNLKGDLKTLQKELQKKCASGGSIKNGTIEIQGDHLNKIKTFFEEKGYSVKQVGG
jgi:translation initiation factor 1